MIIIVALVRIFRCIYRVFGSEMDYDKQKTVSFCGPTEAMDFGAEVYQRVGAAAEVDFVS